MSRAGAGGVLEGRWMGWGHGGWRRKCWGATARCNGEQHPYLGNYLGLRRPFFRKLEGDGSAAARDGHGAYEGAAAHF